jgi:hypothetical protein
MKSNKKILATGVVIATLSICAAIVYGVIVDEDDNRFNDATETVKQNEKILPLVSSGKASSASNFLNADTRRANREAHAEAMKAFLNAKNALESGNCDLAEELVSIAIAKAAETFNDNQSSKGMVEQTKSLAKQSIQEMWAFLNSIAEARNADRCGANTDNIADDFVTGGSLDSMQRSGASTSMNESALNSIEQQIIALLVQSKVRRATHGNMEDSLQSQGVETISGEGEHEPGDRLEDEPEEDLEAYEKDDLEETNDAICKLYPDICRCIGITGYTMQQLLEETDINKLAEILLSGTMLSCTHGQR